MFRVRVNVDFFLQRGTFILCLLWYICLYHLFVAFLKEKLRILWFFINGMGVSVIISYKMWFSFSLAVFLAVQGSFFDVRFKQIIICVLKVLKKVVILSKKTSILWRIQCVFVFLSIDILNRLFMTLLSPFFILSILFLRETAYKGYDQSLALSIMSMREDVSIEIDSLDLEAMLFLHVVNKIKLSSYIILFHQGRIMTLVYRSAKLRETVPNQNPGPGAYKIKELTHNDNHPSAAFLSKVERQKTHEQDMGVSPFSYFKDITSAMGRGEGGQSAFKSKIERFAGGEEGMGQISKQKQFAQEFNQLMRKEKNGHSSKGKLMDLKLKRQKQQKLNDLQYLPSIPSNQQSYGYRVDCNTNKLVNNYNPKVLFTKNNKPKEDFYFQRSQKSLRKSTKCLINSTVKRSLNELAHQLSNPTVNAYHADKYNTIEEHSKKVKKSTHAQSSLACFDQNSPSKRYILKMSKMRRDFDMYIDKDHFNLSELQALKNQNKFTNKSPVKLAQSSRPQCFLTAQSRFYEHKEKVSPQKSTNKQAQKSLTNKDKTNEDKTDVICEEQKRKEPFSLGKERFKQKHKQNLGPGIYQLKQQTFNHGVSLKQTSQRFKKHSNTCQVRGPGSYQVRMQFQMKERVRCQFSKHRNNQYFNQMKTKEHSMEDLYQQVGKHMNYLNKIEKLDSKAKKNRHSGLKRADSILNLDKMSQAKKNLRQRLQLANDQCVIDKENRSCSNSKNLTYSHLYGYKKPQEKVTGLGPGCYQIRSNLNKKTFNKTVNS